MKWSEILSSRTNWVLAFGVLVTVVQALAPFINSKIYEAVMAVLLALAAYFRSNPTQGVYVDKRIEDIPMNKE